MEAKLKHLEFIQDVIKRMNSNSFLIKGWCITLISAIFAITHKNSGFFLIPYFSIPIFWGLDSYYLSQEKRFRELYNHVASLESDKIDFSMNIKDFSNPQNSWIRCVFSKSVAPIYLTIIFAIVILIGKI
jgi:hypothetical protein